MTRGQSGEQLTAEHSAGRVPERLALVLMVIILLVAAAFRFIGLDNFPTPQGATPPGLEHDEVAHWLINQDILAGQHAIYFTEAYGHEALYHYVQAAFGAMVGDHALALRLPSAYFGILLVVAAYALGRRLFGVRVALWSAAFLAVLFWPVFYSRLALRAISLPVFSGLAAYWWWRAFPINAESDDNPGIKEGVNTARLGIAGLFAGLSIHTYMAARAVPIFFALYFFYLLVWHRVTFRRHWRGPVLFWLVFIAVAAPLAIFLLSNPNAEVRVAEVDAPLRAFLSGDFRPVLENAARIAGMFGVRGDPLWRQNVADRPVFDPIMGFLFYAGVALSLWRWRDPRHAFMLLWLATSVIPSLVTVDAPSSIRIINLLPVLMLFPLVLIHNIPRLSTIREKLSTDLATSLASARLVTLGLGFLLVWSAWSTYFDLWRVWPANDEVRFVWQAALTEAAAYLDHSDESGAVAVGGWTPETMDPPTMTLSLRRDDLALRYFDPTQSLIIPALADGQPIRIVRPTISPLATPLQDLVKPWEEIRGEFTLYRLPDQPAIEPRITTDVNFGGQLIFMGYDVVEGCKPGTRCEIMTYWLIIAPSDDPLRFFIHAVDEAGQRVAQDDRLGAPAEHWREGDIIVQLLALDATAAELRLGIYNPLTDQRLLTRTGADYIALPEN